MNRYELDCTLKAYPLSPTDIERALTLTGNRATASEWRSFAARSAGMAGVAALGAGLIFFIAANWQAMGIFGRFAMVQAALILFVSIALWKAAAASISINATKRTTTNWLPGALILATLASGTLLALFGQTYQTGADVYELFFFWALLTLPFALAGMSGALWGVWVCILNVALALFSGWHGPGDFVWAVFDRWGVDKATAMMLPFAVNLACAALAYGGTQTRYAKAAPAWLVRLLLTFAFAYGTSACLYAITASYSWRGQGNGMQNLGVFVAFALVSMIVAIITLRQKRDVYPLALITTSWIVVSTTFLVRRLLSLDIGGIFLLAIWLIAVSTAAGFLLMRFVKAWRPAPVADPQTGERV
jgi:uncharacterized membrane protein